MFTSRKQFIYPVKELAKSIDWYSDVLASSPVMDSPNTAMFEFGENRIRLEGPGANVVPCENTPVLAADPEITYSDVYWEVENVDGMLKLLLNKGALLHTPVYENHRIRIAKAVDPFGNVIGLFEKCKSFGEIPKHTTLSAFCRALAVRDHRQFLRGPDHFAYIFLDVDARELVENQDKRRWAIANLVTSPVYGYFHSRTEWFDNEFKESCRRNVAQIVMLGAGYDTRTIRFRDHLKTTRIFEIDLPPVLNHKADRLASSGVSSIANLSYVPVDLEKDSLYEKLLQAGFDPHQKTLFFWEGGSFYQSKECIQSLLSSFKDIAAPGSSIIFDALAEELPPVISGEPFRFWVSTEEISSYLAQFDLQIKHMMIDEEMIRKYLSDRSGKVAEMCLRSFYFVHAEKELS